MLTRYKLFYMHVIHSHKIQIKIKFCKLSYVQDPKEFATIGILGAEKVNIQKGWG